MSKIRLQLMLFLALTSYLITFSIAVMVIFILLFFIGKQSVSYFQSEELKDNSLLIFEISYMVYFIYALICFVYMTFNGYEHLQSFDGINVYIPYTKELLNINSFKELLTEIYTTSKYNFVGSILVLFVYIGKLSSLMDGELYVTIQTSIILFASWTTVVIYNILVYNKVSNKKALIYTLLYAFFSIHFYMSTFIVRDMPITFLITVLIYLSFKPFSLKAILIMIACVLLIGSIRISSGIFGLSYIFLLLAFSNKEENSIKQTISLFLLSIFILIAFAYIDTILSIVELKLSQYNEKEIQVGTSTIASFNALPIGISHTIKALYNQIMPIPSWQPMIETMFRPESYNVMNFPIILATLFRYYIWFIIFIGLSFKSVRMMITSNRILFFNLFLAILFLAIQSNTMGHRRLLGVYPIFFLLAILVYQNLTERDKKIALFIPSTIFIVYQFIGLFKII